MTPTTKEKNMAEQAQAMVKEVKAEKKAFMAKPYSREDKIKKEEEELKKLVEEQKGDSETKEPEADDEGTENPTNAEERSFKKRYGDLRRHSQKQAEELKKELESVKKQLEASTKSEIKLPKSDEDIETWAKEYPDVAAIVETIAIKKAKEQNEMLEGRMKEYEDLRVEASKEKAEAELLRLHPDFGEIRDSDEFHEWADQQPKWVQDALYENSSDARSAARAIDLYKVDKDIKPKKKSNEKDAAKAVDTRSEKSKPTTNETASYLKESQVEKMSAQEYEKRSDEIMEAIRSGKFIYDLSGSAR
jgi:hypothetical protein|tara:strand:- start:1359 stop:2270 length:912 start_codon:yes stop_codon:yes gene_type:complete